MCEGVAQKNGPYPKDVHTKDGHTIDRPFDEDTNPLDPAMPLLSLAS